MCCVLCVIALLLVPLHSLLGCFVALAGECVVFQELGRKVVGFCCCCVWVVSSSSSFFVLCVSFLRLLVCVQACSDPTMTTHKAIANGHIATTVGSITLNPCRCSCVSFPFLHNEAKTCGPQQTKNTGKTQQKKGRPNPHKA